MPDYLLPLMATVLVVVGLPVYFLPTIISRLRKHHNWVAIGVLNLFLGWTFLGWVVALVWSCVAKGAQRANGRAKSVSMEAKHEGLAIVARFPSEDEWGWEGKGTLSNKMTIGLLTLDTREECVVFGRKAVFSKAMTDWIFKLPFSIIDEATEEDDEAMLYRTYAVALKLTSPLELLGVERQRAVFWASHADVTAFVSAIKEAVSERKVMEDQRLILREEAQPADGE